MSSSGIADDEGGDDDDGGNSDANMVTSVVPRFVQII